MKDILGHADQEWLLNFIYSFIKKPKQIILVHGEKTAQKELKEKILEETEIPVTIPKYGEIYKLENENIYLEGRLNLESVQRIQKVEIINKVKMLKDEITDMEEILKTEILTEDTKENDINSIVVKLKEIEKIIVSIIE